MDAWKQAIEKDPYEAVFGKSHAWRPFWADFFGEHEAAATKKTSDSKPETTKGTSQVKGSEPVFVYDPVTARMVLKDAADIEATPRGSVDSLVRPFNAFSIDSSSTKDADPLAALNNALGVYDAKLGKKSSEAQAGFVDPLRNALDEYESAPQRRSSKEVEQPIDSLQDALKEYDAQAKSPSDKVPQAEAIDPLRSALRAYESQAERESTVTNESLQDSLQAALGVYDSQQKTPSLTAQTAQFDSLQDALKEYESKATRSVSQATPEQADSLAEALSEYEVRQKDVPVTLSYATDSLGQALQEYETRSKTVNYAAPAQQVDPVREGLKEYESQPKRTTVIAAPETDPVRDCLREYELQPKKSFATPTQQSEPVQAALGEYEASNPNAYTFTSQMQQELVDRYFSEQSVPRDSVRVALGEYDAANSNAYEFTPAMQNDLVRRYSVKDSSAEPVQDALGEYEAKNRKAYGFTSKMQDDLVQRYSSEQQALADSVRRPAEDLDLIRPSDVRAKIGAIKQKREKRDQLEAEFDNMPLELVERPRIPSASPNAKRLFSTETTPSSPLESSLDRLGKRANETGSNILREVHHARSQGARQQDAALETWEGRIDADVHNCLQGYEQTSTPNKASFSYKFSNSNDLDSQFSPYQGSSCSVDTGVPQERGDESLPPPAPPSASESSSVADLISSDAQSILCGFDSEQDKLVFWTTSSDVTDGAITKAIPPARALSAFGHATLIFPYLELLEHYDIVQYDNSLLVLRKRGQADVEVEGVPLSSAVNPIDGTTIPLSPTGFVSYNSAIPPPLQSKPEPVEQRRASKNSHKTGGGAASVLKTAIWAGAACYLAGVAGELLKQQP